MSFPTWSDLNDKSLIPPLGGRYSLNLGSAAVMISTDPDFRYVESNIGKIQSSYPFFLGNLLVVERTKVASAKAEETFNVIVEPLTNINEKPVFDINDCNDNTISLAGPYLGSPQAVMTLESLIARGVSKVLVIGWCGAISDELKTGDILIVDAAISDEGTSRNYIEMPQDTDFPLVFPNSDLSFKVKNLIESNIFGITLKHGKLWTTDAIYRETTKKVRFFNDMGASAVEMECSALFAAAQYHKADIAALMIASDSLSSPKWQPGFKEPVFKESRKRLLNAVIKIMHYI